MSKYLHRPPEIVAGEVVNQAQCAPPKIHIHPFHGLGWYTQPILLKYTFI